MCFVSISCSQEEAEELSSTGIDEIVFYAGFKPDIELKTGENESGYVVVNGNDSFSVSDLHFITTHPSVASFEYDKTVLTNYVYYKITALSDGQTTVYVSTSDGTVRSEMIKITVVSDEETTTAPDTTILPQTTKAPETTAATPETTAKVETTAAPETAKEPETTSAVADAREYILNTNTKKYHTEDCSSAKKIKETNKKSFYGTPSELESMGYEACKNCH